MKTKTKLWIVFVCVIAFWAVFWLLNGCSTTSTPPATSVWTQTYGHNFDLTPKGNGFTFTFPKVDGVHYITKECP